MPEHRLPLLTFAAAVASSVPFDLELVHVLTENVTSPQGGDQVIKLVLFGWRAGRATG